jgi:hypothetical protein
MHYHNHIQSQHSAVTTAVLILIQRYVPLYNDTAQLSTAGMAKCSQKDCNIILQETARLRAAFSHTYIKIWGGGGRFNCVEFVSYKQ